MSRIVETLKTHLWLIAAFVVTVVVVLTIFSVFEFGRLRYFNAGLLLCTWVAWMLDYIEDRSTLYRRQRRLRLAFASVLFSGMYGSLNAAIDPQGDPTIRVILVAVTTGILLVSILYRPDDDLEIPGEIEFPWERWILRVLRGHS